jgi:hypothetical protein
MPVTDVVLKAAAKLEIGLTDKEKIDNSKKKEKKNEEGMKRQHARKALTNWLARIKNKNRSKTVKVDPSASAVGGVDK